MQSGMLESGQITRWLVLAALSLATAVMFAVSLRGNYLFGYSIGQSEEKRWLFGWANVAADVWKAFGLICRLGALVAWLGCNIARANFKSLATKCERSRSVPAKSAATAGRGWKPAAG